ncbi:cytochrome B5-like isoform X2 [Octopus vulgaris]|uniref:Cytochrome B5-like isoform X2 n=2 Tax=Octopus TaxID=6643 RepID=A0AA36BNS3_OCTVU|nr:cytochrome b5 [Octopus sinensis]CAI9737806.1 cytochrome B5-like isoform X2 [Octopus vulgaris]
MVTEQKMALKDQSKKGVMDTISSTASNLLNRHFYDLIWSKESSTGPVSDINHNICDTSSGTTTFSMKDVSEHSVSDSCWIVIRDKVYDITEFLSKHPGGEDILLEHAGRDATHTFEDTGHSDAASNILPQYYIGELRQIDKIDKKK